MQLENLKVELTGKSMEVCSLKGKLDSLQIQRGEQDNQIDMLRQQIANKDDNIELFRAEVCPPTVHICPCISRCLYLNNLCASV